MASVNRVSELSDNERAPKWDKHLSLTFTREVNEVNVREERARGCVRERDRSGWGGTRIIPGG